MKNDEYLLGLLSGLNRKMHVKCLAKHLALVEHKANVAFDYY